MKKYELNPKEELKLEVKPDLMAIARKDNRPILIGTILLVILSLFFWYVMQSISSFYPLLLLIGLIAIAGAIYYVVGMLKATGEPDEKYYITNVRTIIADKDGNIKKEITNNTISKIVEDKVCGNKKDIIINPKEETNPAKLRKHNANKPLYTADTMILKAVDANKVKELIQK